LPPGVTPTLGPDATGVGWVYEYALVDDTGKNNLAQLRTLQDWTLKYALGSVKGVAEVASIGGFVKQYQVNVDPNKLINHGISLGEVADAVRKSNSDVGGKSLEISTRRSILSGAAATFTRWTTCATFRSRLRDGAPAHRGQVATVELGPDLREGLAEFNGQGEAVGGIVVMRFGENALSVIDGVKKKIAQLQGFAATRRPHRAGLRPLATDPAFHRHAARKADRGEHHRQPRLHRLSLASAQRLGGHHHAADGDPALLHSVRGACTSRPTSCRWAALPSPSARWSTRPSS
jgi:hypothetical protein